MKTKEESQNLELIKHFENLLVALKGENENDRNQAILKAHYTLSTLEHDILCGRIYKKICGDIFENSLKNIVDKFLNGTLGAESSEKSKYLYRMLKNKTLHLCSQRIHTPKHVTSSIVKNKEIMKHFTTEVVCDMREYKLDWLRRYYADLVSHPGYSNKEKDREFARGQSFLARQHAETFVKKKDGKSFFMYCEDTSCLFLYRWYKITYFRLDCLVNG